MTREEVKAMLEAKLKCMMRDVSGVDLECNMHKCDECSLNYEQGNMGEQKECLKMAIAALKAEPCEDAISRQAMLDGLTSIARAKAKSDAQKSLMGRVMFFTEQLPPVTSKHMECEDCVSREAVLDALHVEGRPTKRFEYAIEVRRDIEALPPVTPKQRTGKWINLKDEYDDIVESVCSVCDMNGNVRFKYCPYCGAENGRG